MSEALLGHMKVMIEKDQRRVYWEQFCEIKEVINISVLDQWGWVKAEIDEVV